MGYGKNYGDMCSAVQYGQYSQDKLEQYQQQWDDRKAEQRLGPIRPPGLPTPHQQENGQKVGQSTVDTLNGDRGTGELIPPRGITDPVSYTHLTLPTIYS